MQVTVAPAGWRAVLADPVGRTVWTCRHAHPTESQARHCAEREREVPGLAELGFRLRELREAAGLSQAQVAQALECSDSKVSWIETGEVLATPRDARDLAALYRATPAECDALVAVAREARAARAAWSSQQRHHGPDGPDQDSRSPPVTADQDLYAALGRRSPGRPQPQPDRAPPAGPGGGARTRTRAKDGRAPHRQPPTSPPHEGGNPMGTPTLPRRARVAAGAALLDQRRPGWYLQVDGDRLDLEDWRADVLGQLYGSFGAGVHKLTSGLGEAEVDAWTVVHGFDVDEVDLGLSAGPHGAYQALTDAWRGELTHRQGGERR
jgi:transcriptional regulator with XRE-family HTH domain